MQFVVSREFAAAELDHTSSSVSAVADRAVVGFWQARKADRLAVKIVVAHAFGYAIILDMAVCDSRET